MTTYHRRPLENIFVAATIQTPSVQCQLLEDVGDLSALFFFSFMFLANSTGILSGDRRPVTTPLTVEVSE
jgi:hypothetical protein